MLIAKSLSDTRKPIKRGIVLSQAASERGPQSGGTLSEHARGLAIDIAGVVFAGGRVYQVGVMADDAERAFDHAVRAAACGYFHTALGPGPDAFHSSHWHVDLESRGADGKSKFCQ